MSKNGSANVFKKISGVHISLVVLLVLATAITVLYARTFYGDGIEYLPKGLVDERANEFVEKSAVLKEYVFGEGDLESVISDELGSTDVYTVFISVGGKNSRADVVNASASTLDKAWDAAVDSAAAAVRGNGRDVIYIKADFVNYKNEIKRSDLPEFAEEQSQSTKGHFRYGISLDSDFNTAFLEAEINGNRLLNYNNGYTLRSNNIKNYLSEHNRQTIDKLPSKIIIFSCLGYMYDDGDCYTLKSESDMNYGRRDVNVLGEDYMTDVIISGARYLSGLQKKNGSYIYGYYPISDKEIDNYNILRHAGTTWSMITTYRITGDETLVEPIKKGISYLVGESRQKDNNTAFIIESKSNEIKIGANGISLLAILDYMEVFGDSQYDDVAKKIGNGIIDLQDDEGRFFHVLYYGEVGHKNFSEKEQFRTVFYDGESTLGLCKLYKRFGDEKYLDAAVSAVELFIREDYTKYRDHWLSYAMNEITKFVPDERYYEFGLRNVQVNIGFMSSKPHTSSIDLELLMSAFEMYDRIKQGDVYVAYLEDEFDEEFFIETIFDRTDYNMNAFAYPEIAMYLKNPESVLGGFLVRNDSFRIRIDDVQHHIGGYCLYVDNYEALLKYA